MILRETTIQTRLEFDAKKIINDKNASKNDKFLASITIFKKFIRENKEFNKTGFIKY